MADNTMHMEIVYSADGKTAQMVIRNNQGVAQSFDEIGDASEKATNEQVKNAKLAGDASNKITNEQVSNAQKVQDALKKTTEWYNKQTEAIKKRFAEWRKNRTKGGDTPDTPDMPDSGDLPSKGRVGSADSGELASTTAGLRGAIDVLTNGQAQALTSTLEVAEAFADIGDFAPRLTEQMKLLFPALSGLGTATAGAGTAAGTASVGFGAVALALAPVALVAGGVAVAVAGLAAVFGQAISDAQRASAVFSSELDAQYDYRKQALEGMTQLEAEAQKTQLQQKLAFEQAQLQALRDQYESFGFNIFQKIGSGQEEALIERIGEREQAIISLEGELAGLTTVISEGVFATEQASDATTMSTQADIQLTEARHEGITATNSARDAEIERAQQEQERAREQEKLQQEAERNAEKVAQAQQKYNSALIDTANTLKDSIADAITKAKDSAVDAQRALGDDLNAINSKNAITEREARIKALQDEQNAITDHYRTLQDIRRDALRDEQEAISQRDFLSLAQLTKATQQKIEDEQRAFDQSQEDAIKAQKQSQDERARALADERKDRLQAYQKQRRDLKISLSREIRDAQTAYNRKLRDAQIAYQQEAQLFAQHLQQRVALQAQANQAMMGQMAYGAQLGGGSVGIPNAPILGGSGAQDIFARYKAGLQKAVNSSNTLNMNVTSNNPQQVADITVQTMRQLGFLDT